MRSCAAVVHGIYAFPFVAKGLSRANSSGTRRLGPVFRGLLLISPVILVLGALLASADTVFASLFKFDLGDIPLHIVLIALGAWLMGVLFSMASANTPDAPITTPRFLPATEALVGLAAMVLLFGAFAVIQLVVLSGGAAHVLRTANLTYAEHARQGFFQLIAVTVITLGVLMLLRAVTRLDSNSRKRAFMWLSVTAVALTLLIVAVAINRLFLYEDAYGLTMLRLYSTIFAAVIGVVFVLFAISTLGFRSDKSWFLGAAFACSLAVLFALNTVNPEKLVVERNVDRIGNSTQPFDTDYIHELSEDAYPAIADALVQLDGDERRNVVEKICNPYQVDSRYSGWAAFNLSRENAHSLDAC